MRSGAASGRGMRAASFTKITMAGLADQLGRVVGRT